MTAAVLLSAVLVPLAVAAAVRVRRPAAVTGDELSERLRATARTTARWRLGGAALGVVVALISAHQDALGRGLLLGAPLFGLCLLTGIVVGELRVGAPGAAVRTATVEVRRARDYLPPVLSRVVLAATGLLVAVLGTTTALGSPDDLGRAGRALARSCTPLWTTAVGPWPGWFYAAPLLAVVLAGLVLAGLALRRIVHRPRSGDAPHVDDLLRRQAAEAVVAGCGLLVAVPLAGVSLVAAHAVGNLGCAPASWRVVAGGVVLLVPALAALASWCAVTVLLPRRSAAAGAARSGDRSADRR
ncbi:hypothetical protein [Trujillonella humicola]|uniref:hypothetical protein n=1 Tax=Trujillonella humicola TaxID=3383699 RepID=UPI003906C100